MIDTIVLLKNVFFILYLFSRTKLYKMNKKNLSKMLKFGIKITFSLNFNKNSLLKILEKIKQ